ncbi:MAG: LytTR family transcriptional regulator DNA-binding domain-containing protein [Bacteroidota bacterium]
MILNNKFEVKSLFENGLFVFNYIDLNDIKFIDLNNYKKIFIQTTTGEIEGEIDFNEIRKIITSNLFFKAQDNFYINKLHVDSIKTDDNFNYAVSQNTFEINSSLKKRFLFNLELDESKKYILSYNLIK